MEQRVKSEEPMISMAEINKRLLLLMGNMERVKYWWNSPNMNLALQAPIDVFSTKTGQRRVHDLVFNAITIH